MCIVVCKPKNIDLPKKCVLEQCFRSNPDGAGYMFAKDGTVHIKKGFMTFDSFYKSLLSDYSKELAFVLHFRIGTMGLNVPELTHPYPLSKNMEVLRETESECPIGVAHNGIISLTTVYSYMNNHVEPDYNDTMKFITDYMSLIIKDKKFYKDDDTIEIIKKLVGTTNKFALLDGDGHITTIGYFIEEDCIKYSNTSYEIYDYYSDRDWDMLLKKYDKYYDETTESYFFPEGGCPLSESGDTCFCDMCDKYLNDKCKYYKRCK